MRKTQIPIIALGIFSISLLLISVMIANPYNRAFAVTLITKQWFASAKVEDSFFYHPAGNKLILCTTDLSTTPDTRQWRIFDSRTLESTANATDAYDDNQDCEEQHGNRVLCLSSTASCYRVAIHAGGGGGGGSNPAGIMITRFNFDTLSSSQYTNTTWTSAGIGKGLAIVGSLLYFSNTGGAMPQGIWTMNIVNAFDGITTNDDQTLYRTHSIALVSGLNAGCYDALSTNISAVDGNTVGKIDVSTGQWTNLGNNLGSTVDEAVCFDGFAWYASTAGGWVKKVNPSTGATVATITLAGATTVAKHGTIILIGSGSTVYGYDSTSLAQVQTYTGFTGSAVKVLNGNSTSLYVMGSSERIHLYNGIPDSGEEDETPTNNQSGGFCGNGTLRDCLGDRNALSGLVPANQNITSIATTLGQGIGIINPNDENPRTNGTGLFLMLITGSFFAIALMSTVHTLNMRGYISASIREIDPVFWLFLVVGTISVSWYLDWIDDIIFFAMTVGLAGLIAFGVLKHFGRA